MDYAVLRSRAPALPFTSLNWLLLVLCIVIVIVVSFFLFYFNRLVAWTFAFFIRVFFWKSSNVWLECEGLQLSLLAGRIFIKDLRYHSRNESIRILKCHITWRYWLWRTQTALEPTGNNAETESLLKSDRASNLPCRIHAGFEGLEVFFYNRTPAYDEIVAQLRNQQKQEPEQAPYPHGGAFEDPASRPRGFSLDDPEVHRNTRMTVITRDTAKSRMAWLSLGPFSRALKRASDWIHALVPTFQLTDILPISFEGRTCAIVAGNDSTPSILIVEAHKMSGTYGVTACRSKLDLYKTVYDFKLTSVKIITRTNPDYQVSMIERGQAIHSDLSQSMPLDSDESWRFLRFDSFRRLAKAYGQIIRKVTPKPAPKWKGLARYMTDAQRREAGELTHDVEYAKATAILDTPVLDVIYFVDVPGPVPEDARSLGGGGRGAIDVGNGDLPPEWGVELVMHGGSIIYGPWADRQRDLIQKVFFPPTYVTREPTARLPPGSLRMHTMMTIGLELKDDITFRLPTREPSKDWKYDGAAPAADTRRKKDKRPFGWLDIGIGQGSTLNYNMGMAADDKGYSTLLEIHLKHPQLSSSVNGASFWTNQACRILCEMPSPLQWDAYRQWTFDLSFTNPVLYLLRDHTTLITDLIGDWTSGPPSDFNTWVPTDYVLKFGLKDYTVNMYANDHNVIDHPLSDNRNSLFVMTGPSLNAQVDVPSHKFRPHCRTTTFSLEGSKIEASMSLPDWNTHYTFAKQRPISLGSVGFMRLDASYTSYAQVHPDYVEKLVVDIKARNVAYINYAWAIRHFLRIKDNYFGRFTHFSTFQEYSDKKAQGVVGDPILAKYRKEKSNAFEVTLGLNLLDNAMVLPQSIHGCKDAMLVVAPEMQLWLKLHDFFLEMSYNLARATLSISQDHAGLLRTGIPPRPRGPRATISGVDIVANRLFGPQPVTATYLCLWEIKVGDCKGVVSPQFVTALSQVGRALSVTYTDSLNAPDPEFELPLDPDITFLKVSLQSVDIVLKDGEAALHLKMPHGLRLDYNDLAGGTYRKVMSLRLPLLQAKNLFRSPYKKEDWFEVASASMDLCSDMYFSPAGWEESAARQLRFVLEQDSLTKRLKFLYSRDSGQGNHVGDLFLPTFTTPDMRPEPRRKLVPRLDPRPRRLEESESEGEALTEGARLTRLSGVRPATPGRSLYSGSRLDSDRSISSGDESDNIAQSTPHPSSNSEAELSDVPTDSSGKQSQLCVPRMGQQFPSDSTPFLLARDPINVLRWEPENRHVTAQSFVGTIPNRSRELLSATACQASSLMRIRSKNGLEVSITPLTVTTTRTLLASFEQFRPSLESQLDGILTEFVDLASTSYQESPGRSVFDVILPHVKLSLLQRVDVLRNEGSVVAGTPTQLLTAANLQLNELSLLYTNTTRQGKTERSVHPATKEFILSLRRIDLHVHTATSHPRSMPFVPTTLLFATITAPHITFGSTDAVVLSMSLEKLESELGGTAPRLIATTFQSAIRFISKIATTVKTISIRQLRRRRILVLSVLRLYPHTSVWTDPLSWTQASFIVKSGLPARLRADLSWKIIAHIRHRLQDMDEATVHALESKVDRESTSPSPAVQELSSLLADQRWLDWAAEAEHRKPKPPVLQTVLYPPSPAAEAVDTVLRSALVHIELGRMGCTVLGPDSGSNTFSIGPISGRFKVGRRVLQRGDQSSESDPEVLHLAALLSIKDLRIWMQPSLIPFLSEVLRVQRTASRRKEGPKKVERPKNPPIPITAEFIVSLESASLEASALKIIMEARSKAVSFSLTGEQNILPDRALSAAVTLGVEEFRIGTKATPMGSTIAADQDTLAEWVASGCSLSILVRETTAGRDLSVILGQDAFLIHVPRSALKLYHFFREWRMEYKSKYDIMVRDLFAELERAPRAPAQPSSSAPYKKQTYKVDVSLKNAQILLQVMHGTWLSWEISNTFAQSQGQYTETMSLTFAVDLASQVIDIISQQTDSSPESAIRLPLPRFGASGNFSPRQFVSSVVLGRFDIKIKPQYVDDILAIQQKFGSDFAELLDLYTEKRSTAGSSAGPSSAASLPTSAKLSIRLEGFGISLEGPSSTQYLNTAAVEGTLWSDSGHGLIWDATVWSVSLSLAHHSTPHAVRSALDRRFRSAYMDIAFTANNRRPEGSSDSDRYLQIRVSHVHAVMQAAAVGELGDLIDYVQAEMLLRKEQRATELAEIRKKGRLLKTKLEREPSMVEVANPSSWLDEQIVDIEILSTGIAIPLSGDENVRPIHPRSHSISPLIQTTVKAFLFSISSITFSSQRYQRGDLSIREFALQFVPAFDQSRLEHFDGRLHNTNNRLRFPSMRAQMQVRSGVGNQGRSIAATAKVDGLELDLDSSIASYVFSAVTVYRKGKERIERIAPGQARANFDALSSRFASSEAVGSNTSSASGTDLKVSLTFGSGRIRFFAPDHVVTDRQMRILYREMSSITDPLVTSSAEPSGATIGADVVNLPGLSVEASFKGASATERFSGSPEDTVVSNLTIHVQVEGSSNVLRPSILPFAVELMRNIERHMGETPEDLASSGVTNPSHQPSPTESSGIIPAAMAIKARLQVHFVLAVGPSHLSLTCHPDVNVVAALDWDESSITLGVLPGSNEITLGGSVGGIQVSVRHEFLRDVSFYAKAQELPFMLKLRRETNPGGGPSIPSVQVLMKTGFEGWLLFARLQDLLCFKAIWLDRIPVFETRHRPDTATTSMAASKLEISNDQPSATSLELDITAIFEKTILEVDMGSSITKLSLEVQKFAVHRLQTLRTSSLVITVDQVNLLATQRLSGSLRLPNLGFGTTRQIFLSDDGRRTGTDRLEVVIKLGAAELDLQHEQVEQLSFRADPMELQVKDGWADPSSGDGLRLDFTVEGGNIRLIGVPQAATRLINTAARVKALIRSQKEGAARDSSAFRTTLNPKPTNPLSEVAAAMISSARSRFQEEELFDFTIVQHMQVDVKSLQLAFVDGGKTFHLQANNINAQLLRHLRTEASETQRDLHLALGSLVVLSFPAMTELKVTESVPRNATKVFTFPHLIIEMKSSILAEHHELAYEFDCNFPTQDEEGSQTKVYLLLDLSEHGILVARTKDLMARVKRALDDPEFKRRDGDWWDQPLRSNTSPEAGSVSPKTISSAGRSSLPPALGNSIVDSGGEPEPIPSPDETQDEASFADSQPIIYVEKRCSINSPEFQQFDKNAIRMETIENMLGISSRTDLPPKVHEYATVPIEGIMKLLLKVYAQRLRKAGVLEDQVGKDITRPQAPHHQSTLQTPSTAIFPHALSESPSSQFSALAPNSTPHRT
ncbi:hypothetical protein FRC04_003684 [Tulasnella sp. 424]|nr:hypothetical protein FRC04_003684 [Tulasnella sp. 424]